MLHYPTTTGSNKSTGAPCMTYSCRGRQFQDPPEPPGNFHVRVWGVDKCGERREGFLAPGPNTTKHPVIVFDSMCTARSAVARALALWGGLVRFEVVG